MRSTLTTVLSTMLMVAACDSADDGGDMMVPDPCEDEDRADLYKRNMVIDGADGMASVKLIDAEPAPPSKGQNTWTVEVRDADGSPMGGLDIVTVPFMPDHGHGTSVDPTATESADAGEYVIEPILLVMAGYWEITLELGDADGVTLDEAEFKFCVEE